MSLLLSTYALGCGPFVELRRGTEAPKWFQDQITRLMKKKVTKFVPLTEEEKAKFDRLKGIEKEQYSIKNHLRYDYDYSSGIIGAKAILGRITSKYETVQVPIVSATGWDGGEVVTSMTKVAFHALTGISLGRGEVKQMRQWSVA